MKNVLVRRDYRPSRTPVASAIERVQYDFQAGRLTAEELLSRYATMVYHQTGNYQGTWASTGGR